ncbi:MAG: hypothetical protein HFF50_01910 [Lawsonibacter sp.]|nr:hypothetical protein [Lawsonibacter sp.]MCI8914167.1 hypothetical protein [Lawsonibacter sp.]
MSSALLIASDFPLKEVPYPSDFVIQFDIDHRTVEDGGREDGFAIFPIRRVLELSTKKRYFAGIEWNYTPGRTKNIIEYLREHLEHVEEVELWHIWQDMDFDHKVRKVKIPIHALTADDIQELSQLDVWKEPVVDYCYVVTRAVQ